MGDAGVQQARGHELPRVEADDGVQLGEREAPERPERKIHEQHVARDALQHEDCDVQEDQYTGDGEVHDAYGTQPCAQRPGVVAIPGSRRLAISTVAT